MEEILEARTNIMYDKLIESGVPSNKIKILDPLYESKTNSTSVNIAQFPKVPGIIESQIKD